MKKIRLNNDERIVAVVPRSCSGPGWSNQLVLIYIAGSNGIRELALQPKDQPTFMRLAFRACEEAHSLLLSEAQLLVATGTSGIARAAKFKGGIAAPTS